MNVHDFAGSLAYSHAQSDQPFWEEVYRQAFPDMVAMIDLRHDGWHQRAGRDRSVVLSSGRSLYIDEKVREKAWPDIALEVWSTYPLGGPMQAGGSRPWAPHPEATPGWCAKPLDCDFVAYAFIPSSTCHLFPFPGLRAAWEKYGEWWCQAASDGTPGYRWIVAQNRKYQTVSVSVPTDLLHKAVTKAMTVTWG